MTPDSFPDSVDDAVAFVDGLLASPGVEMAGVDGEWPLLRQKLLSQGLKGNLVTDAWIASSVEAMSEYLVTFDRDFERLLPARDLTVLAVPA